MIVNDRNIHFLSLFLAFYDQSIFNKHVQKKYIYTSFRNERIIAPLMEFAGK